LQLSILIPLLNEEASIMELYRWILRVVEVHNFTYEIIFVDDGSTDNSWYIISDIAKTNTDVRGIRFFKNFGKSQALHAGFEKAIGDVVITMDADLQDSPEEIPGLYNMIVNDDYDVVSGWKKKRYDAFISKNVPSKLFNWAARKTSGIQLHDFNCGLKAYKNQVVKHIDVNGEMHRYIPILCKNAGFENIGEKVVKHQARKYGKTKFGMSRFIYGFLDLITIWFISNFAKKPMHLFGTLGVVMFFIGFLFSMYLGIDKLFFNPEGRLITQRPQFYIALFTMLIGTLFFVTGFLGELILRYERNHKNYIVKDLI